MSRPCQLADIRLIEQTLVGWLVDDEGKKAADEPEIAAVEDSYWGCDHCGTELYTWEQVKEHVAGDNDDQPSIRSGFNARETLEGAQAGFERMGEGE
jgi:hypothetical protein